MYGIKHRIFEECGADQQERLRLCFDKLFARERDTALGDLYSYWLDKRMGSKELPSEADFASRDHLPESARIFTAWVEAKEADPFNYIVRNHPGMSNWADQSNRRLSELPSKMNARSCAMEYLTCAKSRQPMYHEIEQTIEDNSRHYARLLLPVLDSSDNVTKLIYAVRMFSATGLKAVAANSRSLSSQLR